jgi:peptidyl-prolyl cis-trans isomerase C
MKLMNSRTLALAACLLVGWAASGCRKSEQPPRAGGPADGSAAPTNAGGEPQQAKGAGGSSATSAVVEPEPDWSGLTDEGIAQRSEITVDECRLALAEGDGFKITVCDFIREVNSLPPRYRARFDSLERRKELLEDMISLAVMEQEAKRLGYDRDPETEYYLERLLADKMEAQLKTELRQQIRQAISEEDQAAYFEAHRDQYNRPELASAAHILVATEQEAQELIAQLTAPDADRNLFAKLAAEKSLDAESKDRGGNLAYFTRPDVHSERFRSIDPAIAAVVFSMQNIGDIHPQPVRTAEGFHVLKLTGKRAAVVRTLEQVRPAVRVGIEEERFNEAWKAKLAELESQLGVELHPENLADVRPTPPSAEELAEMADSGHGVLPPPPGGPVIPPGAMPGPTPPPGPGPSILPPVPRAPPSAPPAPPVAP